LFLELKLSRDYLGYLNLNNNIEAISDKDLVLALKARMTVMKEIRKFGVDVNQRKSTGLELPTFWINKGIIYSYTVKMLQIYS
jgi:hypothetical protein